MTKFRTRTNIFKPTVNRATLSAKYLHTSALDCKSKLHDQNRLFEAVNWRFVWPRALGPLVQRAQCFHRRVLCQSFLETLLVLMCEWVFRLGFRWIGRARGVVSEGILLELIGWCMLHSECAWIYKRGRVEIVVWFRLWITVGRVIVENISKKGEKPKKNEKKTLFSIKPA